jgi:hypothetical protein
MLEKRSWKYKSFLRFLRIFKYISFAPVRGEFLESYYILMRYLDDIVDGDVQLPGNHKTSAEYICEKIRFAENPVHPADEVDYLMIYCFQLANKFKAEFHSETKDILNSLLFDAHRRDQLNIYTSAELNEHFHRLDIRGTIRATLKIFNDDPDKYKLLRPLGIACRIQYDLEDFESDIAAGYINISKEEFNELNIKKEDLFDVSSTPIKIWFRKRAQKGMELLEEHHQLIPAGKFSLLERATFKLVYENPARRLFMQILTNDN